MKYVRIALAFLIGALVTWGIGMWLWWDAYPFWLTGKSFDDGAGMTRYAMLVFGFATAAIYGVVQEARQ
jgi:hypothetical protein